MNHVSVLNKRRIFVAGHNGMVGRAIVRALRRDQDVTILTAERVDLNLVAQTQVQEFFATHIIDEVYLCAAKVGGIFANTHAPAAFIYENLMIEANVIHAAHLGNVDKLLFLGSSCIYPKCACQPMSESALLSGVLEPTNEPYAIAKIAGIKLCESYNRQYGRDFRSVMPTNLFGPYDNFDAEMGHVIPAMLRRFHEAVANNAPDIEVWGSGQQKREFLFVDDLAEASLCVMALAKEQMSAAVTPMRSHINIGTGKDISINALAGMIASVTGFEGAIRFDDTKPDGAARKLLDVSLISAMGWKPKVGLHAGLELAYDWFVANHDSLRS